MDMAQDEIPVGEPTPETPVAECIRFSGMADGVVAFELFTISGEPIAYGLIAAEKIDAVRKQFDMACQVAAACNEPGLSSMTPVGRA